MLVPKLRFKREDGTDYPEWRYARTDEIAEINPKTSDLPNRFYYMDLGSVSRGAWQEKTITDKDNAPSRANRLASVGDVFFQSVRPYNMGHFFFEEEYEYPVVASTGFIQLRATQEYYNGFIYQLLYEDRFNAEVNIRCTGSNYPAINSENFSDIEMLFPCLEEQRKIADFLSAVDEVIAQSEKEVQNLEQQKKAAMQKIFSQEVRFKREDGAEYPGWENTELNSIGSFYGGLSGKTKEDFGKGNSKFITYMNIYKNTFAIQEMLEMVDVSDNEKQNKVEYGDLLMTQSSETVEEVGMSSVYLFRDKPYLNSFCFGMHLHNHSYTYPMYIGLLMRSEIMRKQIMCEGQGISRINLSPNRIKNIILPSPCLEEQQKIADFLSAYDEAISYAKQELDKWKELKKGLLQQMFV